MFTNILKGTTKIDDPMTHKLLVKTIADSLTEAAQNSIKIIQRFKGSIPPEQPQKELVRPPSSETNKT